MEWKVELDAVDLEQPEVEITLDLRLRRGQLRLRELRFLVTNVGGGYDGTDLFRRLRLGSLHSGAKHYLRDSSPRLGSAKRSGNSSSLVPAAPSVPTATTPSG